MAAPSISHRGRRHFLRVRDDAGVTGLANGFRVEASSTVNSLGIDYFMIQNGAAGPFLGSSPFAQTEVERAQRLPGVQAAAAVVYAGPRPSTTERRAP